MLTSADNLQASGGEVEVWNGLMRNENHVEKLNDMLSFCHEACSFIRGGSAPFLIHVCANALKHLSSANGLVSLKRAALEGDYTIC